MRFDAIVIGAGPAGSTAARLLAKAGRNVALIEKAQFPRRKVCGEYISAATMPLLDRLGVGRAFLEMAGPKVARVAFYAGDSITGAPLPSGGGRALGREHLDTLLRDAALAAGVTLYQPAELLDLKRNGDHHVARLDDTELHAPILIAASGSWSVKGPFAIHDPTAARLSSRRSSLGTIPRIVPFASRTASHLLAFKAHLRGGHLPDGLMPLLAFPGGYGGLVMSDAGRLSLSCCIRRDALEDARARHHNRAAEAVLAHIIATTKGAALALDGAVPEGALLAAGPIRPGIRARYRDGIFFTGNLAGEAHPVIAEGISMAIQSSSLLAAILTAEPDIDVAGARYGREWLARFAPRLSASMAFAHLAMRAPSRAMAAGLVSLFPGLLTFGARLAGKSA
jgi:flavin-dependent dehydrogenase